MHWKLANNCGAGRVFFTLCVCFRTSFILNIYRPLQLQIRTNGSNQRYNEDNNNNNKKSHVNELDCLRGAFTAAFRTLRLFSNTNIIEMEFSIVNDDDMIEMECIESVPLPLIWIELVACIVYWSARVETSTYYTNRNWANWEIDWVYMFDCINVVCVIERLAKERNALSDTSGTDRKSNCNANRCPISGYTYFWSLRRAQRKCFVHVRYAVQTN